jgi:hypothetical protein
MRDCPMMIWKNLIMYFYIAAHKYSDILISKPFYRKPSPGIDIDKLLQKVYFIGMRICNKT